MPRRYWLLKSEPESYSWQDLWKEHGKRTPWDGVRNYQARNLMRDEMQVGDGALFYHSSCDPMVIAGICKVVAAGHPEAAAFEKGNEYFDSDSDPKAPTWYCVDVEAVRAISPPLERTALAKEKALAQMELLRRGSRLSVQKVTSAEWRCVLGLAGIAKDPW